ncbi:MAG: S8 family serine peptidase [Steroidobacteraceae bacterium]|nr:S8 family serine peptidase [Steroidobacteraceae bacterium]
MKGRMRNGFTKIVGLLALAWFADARAQLPNLELPGVPVPPVRTEPLLRDVGDAVGRLPTRALRIERLAARNRPELDRDSRGELVVRAEVVGIDITDEALRNALARKFQVARTRELADLAIIVTVLRTPEGMSATRGLKVLRKLDPAGTYDFNHVYLDAGNGDAGGGAPNASAVQVAPAGATRVRVGLIDGGVDARHAALARVTVHPFGCDGDVIPDPHGTAVASVMSQRDSSLELFAANVYCGKPAGGAVDSMAAAFGWLARENVAVINVSLVGPRNSLLARVVATLVKRGYVIVAAVGNDGPAAPPLFPAAYDGVVGVTAVDAKHRVLMEACRGKHVDFAAQGADVNGATQPPDVWVPVRGTSFAAPVVALQLAIRLSAPDPAQRERALADLTTTAIDLGKNGRDDIYGAGQVGAN